MSQTRDQNRVTISEVAADWHELMLPQRTHYAAIRCVRQRTIGPTVQHADIAPHLSARLGLRPVLRKLLLTSHPAEGRRLS